MQALVRLIGIVEPINEWIGRWLTWLTLGTVLACFGGVFMRYVLNIGFIWMQDLYVWMHATVFVLGAGYTYLHNGHVRVDIFYARLSVRGKAWVDLLGCIFWLLPWLALVFFTSLPQVQLSWRLFEPSGNPGGLPGLFLLKSEILVFTIIMALQALAVMARSVLVLNGRQEFGLARGGH